MSTQAEVTVHRYSTGKRFFLVECQPCLIVLNSGHHYTTKDEPLAQALADEHNAIEHSDTIRSETGDGSDDE